MRKIFVTITLLLIFNILAEAQSNSIYFNTRIYQSTQLNPARQPKCKVTIGFPVFSSLYFDFKNTGFAYKSFFKEDETSTGSPRFLLNIDGLYDQLKPINYELFTNRTSLGSLGFRINDFYISLDANLNTLQSFSYPNTILKIKDGNYFDDGSYISATGLGLNFLTYMEYSLGISKEIFPGLVVGGKLKILKGIINFSTEKFQIDWQVSTADTGIYDYTFNTSYMIHYSSLAKFQIIQDEDGYITDMNTNFDQLGDNLGSGDVNTIRETFKLRNNGFAIDLGAIYTLNDKFEFSTSLVNLGFIKWKSNPLTIYTDESSFTFSGINIDSYIGDRNIFALMQSGQLDSIMNNYQNDILDTILTMTYPKIDTNSFSYGPYTTMRFAAAYIAGKWFTGGLLYTGTFMNKRLLSAFTVSANLNFGRAASLSVNYNTFPNSYNNFGFALSGKIGPFHSFIVFDNISPAAFMMRYAINPNKPYNEGFATNWLKSTRMLNFQIGFNLVFGCKQKYDFGLID